MFSLAQWLPAYRPHWLALDAIAGVTVAADGIPVLLAYATLAGGDPVRFGPICVYGPARRSSPGGIQHQTANERAWHQPDTDAISGASDQSAGEPWIPSVRNCRCSCVSRSGARHSVFRVRPDRLQRSFIVAKESSMKNMKFLVIAALAAIPPAAWAQPQSVEVTKAPGQATIKGTTRVTATVQNIDPATRTVLLKPQNGKIVEVQVGEEARNFDQLKVGDVVTAVYRQSLTLSLQKNVGATASTEEQPMMERAPKGGKPGGTVGRQVTIVADVVAVNPNSRTVTLKGPKGNTVDLKVEDPAQFANIKKGDQVQAVYTEALAISVEPAVKK
ncbi:Cu/Ag efflux protein CusF [Paraburkholderia sp. 40]